MRKIENPIGLSICRKFIEQNPKKEKEYRILINYVSSNITDNLINSRIKIATKIAFFNETDFISLYDEYISTNSQKRKIEITKGKKELIEYENKLSKRPKPKIAFSILDINYWIRVGLNEEEAKLKISEIQKKNSNKRKKDSYFNFSKKLKISIDYWTNKGYSIEEAELLREPYLNKCKNDLTSMIDRYGEDEGTKKYIKRIEKYKKSMSDNLGTRGQFGYVSKESKLFFIPIYKKCRRLGFERNQIYFGIKGSREFFIRDESFNYNTGKFYDFAIPKINLIVEYHGTYWHPRNIEEWRNPSDFYVARDADLYKEFLAKNRGMEYVVVWSDDNFKNKQKEIISLIEEKYDKIRKS